MANTLKLAAGTLGVAAAAYAGYAATAWLRYGNTAPATGDAADRVLDRMMPLYDIVERHHIDVAAPADVTFAAACEQDPMALPIVRAIFKGRELLLGSEPDTCRHPRGLLPWMKSIGWGVLAEVPGREIVMGGVTKPWEADPVFRPLPPDQFAAFIEPGFVKIAWTLRADPMGPHASIFRTETRAIATDAYARAKFRTYWSLLSPGIIAIRWALLWPLKAEAERRVYDARLNVASSVFSRSSNSVR